MEKDNQQSESGPSAKKMKIENCLNSTDYYMGAAVLASMRSQDPNTKVGACIVNQEEKIVSVGYNCMPNGSVCLPWERSNDDPLQTKYPYVCHAELNAFINKNSTDVKGCTIYVTLFPCNECTKLIIQAGIKKVVYLSDKYPKDWKTVASKKMLNLTGIPYEKFESEKTRIEVSFET
ncbi:hypothetical protein PAMP_020662 [Pampus punctatissimus]